MPTRTAAKAAAGKRDAATKRKGSRSGPKGSGKGAKAGKVSAKPARKAEDLRAEQLEQKVRELERQLQEAKEALGERSEQLADTARSLDAARRDLEAMRETARMAETHAGPSQRSREEAAGKVRCPRCSGPMTEYDHDVVRADRCDQCHGIFFDDGELELVVDKVLKDHDGQKQGGWFSSLFGRSGKAKTT